MRPKYEKLKIEELIEEVKIIGSSHALLYPIPYFESADKIGELTQFVLNKYGNDSDELSLVNSAYLLGFKQEKLSVVHECFTLLLQYFSENRDYIVSLPFTVSDVYKALADNNEEFLFDWMSMIYYEEPGIDAFHDEELTMPYFQLINGDYALLQEAKDKKCQLKILR